MDLRQRSVKSNANGSEVTNTTWSKKQPEMKRRKLMSLKSLTRIICVGFIFLYVIVPALVHFSTTIQTNLIFLSSVRWPWFIDLTSPESCGSPDTRNFYLTTNDGIKLGTWHVLPASLQTDVQSRENDVEFFETSLKNGLPIILYAHGNSGTRGGSHRVELYNVLRKLNYHIVTFDYRGYADSSNISPSEDGVVDDARFVYKWLRKLVPAQSIIVWGHSLGTGVATKLVQQLCDEDDAPNGLILESPFNNLRDEVKNHPLVLAFRYMPYFDEIFLDAIEHNIEFASDKRIGAITIPIQILHAEDDVVVPISLGQKLYVAAEITRPVDAPPVKFNTFEGHFGYGHKYICHAPELPKIISNFVELCRERN